LSLLEQCQPKPNSDNTAQAPTAPTAEITPAISFDSIVQVFKDQYVLTNEEILELKIIDTTYSYNTEVSLRDTTIQLNDSIFYSVISLYDKQNLCSFKFIVTIDEKNKKAIASQYLQPDCDVDFSRDSYELYNHKVISSNRIQLTKTTVFQKKDRTSLNEQENIDHKEVQNSFVGISQAGQISIVK